MAELPEVAIAAALLSKAQDFADSQSLVISMPGVAFTPPDAQKKQGNQTIYGRWLRATLLQAPSEAVGISFRSHVQHIGILQLDCFVGAGAGELAPGRIASAAIQFFARGTQLLADALIVRLDQAPRRGPLIIQDSWAQVPVSIPYQCFARP